MKRIKSNIKESSALLNNNLNVDIKDAINNKVIKDALLLLIKKKPL
jgi:hypothetical protein